MTNETMTNGAFPVSDSGLCGSLWEDTAIPAIPTAPLAEDARCDVAIVGAGYMGLSAAIALRDRGVDVCVLEGEAAGFGASGRNQGHVVPAYTGALPRDIIARFGEERGKRFNHWVQDNADQVFSLIERFNIECEARREGWLMPARTNAARDRAYRLYEQWSEGGYEVSWLEGDETRALTGSPLWSSAWQHHRGGNIQPLSYARGLAAGAVSLGARLHEGTPVTAIHREGGCWRLDTPRGRLLADKAILCANAYLRSGLWPSLAQTIVPHRLFQSATEPLSDNVARSILPGGHGMSDASRLVWAFRKDSGRRLITGTIPISGRPGRRWLERAGYRQIRQSFPQLDDSVRLRWHWNGMIAMTTDRLPRVHTLAEGLYAGHGSNGRGIAMATGIGIQLARRAMSDSWEECDIPPAPLKPLPLHGLVVPLSRAVVGLYRWRDNKEELATRS